MIRRERDNSWLLISQVDHAHLAADLAAAWGNDDVAPLPLAEWLLPAIRDHDAGWRRWEAAPTITEEGLPRTFTEMSADEATNIWSKSIETCASGLPSSAEALRRLRSAGGEVSPDDAAALDTIVVYRGFVPVERLRSQLLRDADVTEPAIDAALQRLEQKTLIRAVEQPLGGPALEINLPTVGASPLGAVWVSRHFTTLAEHACESKGGDDDAVMPLRRFLSDQEFRQRRWLNAAKAFAGDDLDRVADTGFRYVQFFDRISLWLCMAERDEPWEATLSSKLTLRFTPVTAEITVEPWPFKTAVLEVAVPTISIEADSLFSDKALRHVVKNGERQTLRWVLTH